MTFRVWFKDEFDGFDDEDEREDRAWKVPDEVGLRTRRYPCRDVEEAATKYAEYFHDQRDGYEDTWPLTFVVHDGERYHVVEVGREFSPEFHVIEAKLYAASDETVAAQT